MFEAGFRTISHNCSPLRSCVGSGSNQPCPMASGIIIAVRSEFVGNWEDVTFDREGRVVAGNLSLVSGVVARVLGVYGPSGACLPTFTSDSSQVAAEEAATTCLEAEIARCAERGWICIVAGDMNSFMSVALDSHGGAYQTRESTVAACLQSADLRDTFRECPPNIKAFTYYASSGAASRLDQIWVMATPTTSVRTVNSSIVWAWPKRADHDPAVADFGIQLPAAPGCYQEVGKPWRRLLTEMADSAIG